ncbi:MAG: hypothetical protein DLD55_01095 [candidate division SR1 bacterium]|nr:MAG: hypothetical protein DLD55_01095 [candidate division SR1 bacterium]
MKRIWKIYWADVRRVFSNRVAALIVVVLCILPSLYAWFYLKSSRDPYGNTQGIKVAVVNQDLGAGFQEHFFNIGAEVVEELKANQAIGWVFVDEKIAEEGVRKGQYYASIVIESGFSEKMTTLLDELPQHPEIRYTVNEKINAIAPKITGKGAETIKENIQRAFVDTVNRVLMEKLNLIGFDLKQSKQSVYSLIDFVHDARESLDHLDEKITKMLEISYRSRFRLEELYGELPELKKNLAQGKTTLANSALLAQNSLNFLETTPQKLKVHKNELQQIADEVDAEFSRVLHKAEQTHEHLSDDLQALNPKLQHLENEIGTQIQSLTKLKGMVASVFPQSSLVSSLDRMIGKLSGMNTKSHSLRATLSSANSQVEQTLDFGRDTQKAVQELRKDFKTTLDEVHQDYEQEIEPLLTQVLTDLRELSVQGVQRVDRLEKRVPEVQRNLEGGIDILNTEIEKVRSFQEKLPKLQGSVGTIDRQLQKRKNNGKIDEIIDIATLDPGRFSSFIAEPVELVENKLFSIPNYGSAMSPFFTTLAIWVGSLLSISLFTTKSREKAFYHCKNYQKYLGKWLFFLSIALLQALVVALGDVFLLKAYVADFWAFLGVALWAATVFSLIVYTTVSSFGSAGKAMVIVFLVLQLSGAGGTFPIELSSPFFQAINPFLPFTYAIAAMREAVGGVVWEIYLPNLLVLLGFFGFFLLMGLFLKPHIAAFVARFEQKFSASELGEH